MKKLLLFGFLLLSIKANSQAINVDSLILADTTFNSWYNLVNKTGLDTIPTYDSIIEYKNVCWKQLYLRQYRAIGIPKKETIVFYYGGGWVSKAINQHQRYAYWFSLHGYNTFLVEYRVMNDSSIVTPFNSLEDAKFSIRFLRENAVSLEIQDTSRIVGCGMSAGGHLAAATVYIDGFESTSNTSSKVNALMLQNPVIDLSLDGYVAGNTLLGSNWKLFSPLQHINNCGNIPSMIVSGTSDPTAPFIGMERWDSTYKSQGCSDYLYAFPGRIHGFSNYNISQSGPDHRDFYYTIYLMTIFLNQYTIVQDSLDLGYVNPINSLELKKSLKIITNPSMSYIDIESDNPIKCVSVFDLINNEELYVKSDFTNINLSEISPGAKLMKIQFLNEKIIYRKFIKY